MATRDRTLTRDALERYLRDTLQTERFANGDYCPNGLQVEGRAKVQHIVTGVTASLALINAVRAMGADTLIVHHGYFWRGEDARVVGQKQRRLKALLEANMNLFAFHLPLDAHPTLGNNAQLAKQLGLKTEFFTGDKDLVHVGKAVGAKSLGDLSKRVTEGLNREPIVVGDLKMKLGKVAWCTGAAQGYIEAAHAVGATAYISGEISEPTAHFAREMGIAYLACGHHATERYGVQALGQHLARKFGIKHQFMDIDNPA